MTPSKDDLQVIQTHLQNAVILLSMYPTSQKTLSEFKAKYSQFDFKTAANQSADFLMKMAMDVNQAINAMEQEQTEQEPAHAE